MPNDFDFLKEACQITGAEWAALAALKAEGRHGRLPRDLSPARMLQLEQELREKRDKLTRDSADISFRY
ncbi:hypothetical protein GW813_12695 [bacterium]|nr:hypothetical protein [bacterium]